MATLFSCIVPTHDGDTYRVNIDDADYVGSAVDVELAYGAFSLRYEGDSRDLFSPVMPSKCTVAIAVSDDNLATVQAFGLDLIESGEQRFTVRIDHKPIGGSYALYWVGYVIPDLSGFQDITPPYLFNVVAADGLGRLKKIDYKGTSGDEPVTELTALDHVLYALGKDTVLRDLYYTGSDIYIRTTVNWQDSNMGTPAAAKCPLANTKFSGAVFSDKTESTSATKKFNHMNCFEVIESIARHFAARFYFCEGSWRFEQLNERDQTTFFERRFSKLGVYVSSVSAQTKDELVQNTGLSNRLAGGVFSYLPALNKVQANYLHNTGGNRLEGYQNYWSSLSPFSAIVQFFTTSLSSNNVFRISGAINFEAELDTAYVSPWRYIFRLYVKVGTYTLEGLSTNLFIGGNGTTTLNPVVPAWNNTGTNYYEISSSFCFGTLLSETINFTFDTPPLPTGTTFEVAFYTYLADNVDGTGESATVNYWNVLGPSLLIRDAADPSADYETERQYIVTNDTVGNSEELEQDFLFGHPVSGATVGGVLTSPNSGVFTLSTATWDQGTGTENYEFPQLWAAEIIAGRSTSRPVWSGSIKAAEVFANTRVIFPDNSGWIFLGGEFSATENTWTGEWVQAGVLRSLVLATAPYIKINDKYPFSNIPKKLTPFKTTPPGSVVMSGGFPALTGFTGLAITALAVNEVGSTVSAGAVTTIPLGYAINANDYLVNDDIIIVNPSTGEVTPVTVSATSSDGDTSLSIFSATVPNIPAGALILYGPLNKFTKQGGSHGKMPVGTAEGQALIWNNATDAWEPYSGLSDGHVLTWDTANGWQSEAAGGGVPSGTDTQTLRYSGTTLTANSTITNDGTYVGVGGAVSTNYTLRVKAAASTKGLFIERNSSSAGVHIYHDGTGKIQTNVSTGLHLLSDQLIEIRPIGGGSYITQCLVQPQGNITGGQNAQAILGVDGSFIVSSTGGDFSAIKVVNTINQTGSANQVTRGLHINPTLTAVTTGYRGIEYAPSSQTFLYQASGTSVKSHLIGLLGIGTGTTSPNAKLHVVGNGSTSSTFGANIYNSTFESPTLSVRDDGRVGILTNAPAVSLDVATATDSIALPTSTTANRPSVDSSVRMNTDVGGLEVRYNAEWKRLTSNKLPTISAGLAAGTGASAAITSGGNDLCHRLEVTTGTGTTTGTLCQVTFNQALHSGTNTVVVFCAADDDSANEIAKFYIASTDHTGYYIACRAAPTISRQFIFYVIAKQ